MSIETWEKAIALMGDKAELTRDQLKSLKLTADVAEDGWYRVREDGGDKLVPLTIWTDAGIGKTADLNGKPVHANRIASLFSFGIKRPVSAEAVEYYEEHGQWPDSPGLPMQKQEPIDESLPPRDRLQVEWENISAGYKEFLDTAISDQQRADKAANWIGAMRNVIERADAEFKAEKKPILEAGKQVEVKWHYLRHDEGGAKTVVLKMKRSLDTFLTSENIRKRAEAKRAQEEADRLARDALTAAPHVQKEKEAEAKRAADHAASLGAEKVSAGGTGSKVSQRTVKGVRVLDYDKAALHLLRLNHGDMRDIIDKLAERAIRANPSILLDGCEQIDGTRVQ